VPPFDEESARQKVKAAQDAEGRWWRSHGNELWEFDEDSLMRRHDSSINDYKIEESGRKIRWSR